LDGINVIGYSGGCLGASNGSNWNLKWDTSTNVTINGQLTNTGVIIANGASSQTYSYGYLSSSGVVGTGSGTNLAPRGHYDFDAIFRICNGQIRLVILDPPFMVAAL
jgi:hypothetical protein